MRKTAFVLISLLALSSALPAVAEVRTRQHYYALPNDHLVIYSRNPNNRTAEVGGTAAPLFSGDKTVNVYIWDELYDNVGAYYQFENDDGDDLTNPLEPEEPPLGQGTFCGAATLDIPDGTTTFGIWVFTPIKALDTGCSHGSMGWIKMEISN